MQSPHKINRKVSRLTVRPSLPRQNIKHIFYFFFRLRLVCVFRWRIYSRHSQFRDENVIVEQRTSRTAQHSVVYNNNNDRRAQIHPSTCSTIG